MVAFAAALWTVALVAQAVPASPSADPPPATGLIVGRVVDGASNQPVAGVIVSLSGGISSGGGRHNPQAITNGNGYFVFRTLTRGSYSINATRAGYVEGAYGRRSPNGTAAPLSLAEGQRLADVVIPIWRQAAISGTVTDEAGEPLVGVLVRAFQRRLVGGRYRIVQGPNATTDDRGLYRLHSLVPGDYLVAFVWRETSLPAATADQLIQTAQTNSPQAQPLMRELFTLGLALSASGPRVGTSIRQLAFSAPVPPIPADDSGVFIYPTQFYPGVPSAARAATITVASGQQRDGIDFTLQPVKTVQVSGTLFGPDGPMAHSAVRLVSEDSIADLDTSATITGEGGEFTLLGVPPGAYTLNVLRAPRPIAPVSNAATTVTQIQVGSSTIMSSMSGPAGGATGPSPVSDDPTLFADVPVSVGNRDVSDLVVTVQRGARLTGRIEFDGTRERPDATALTRVFITLDRVDAVAPQVGLGYGSLPGHADDTGAFKTYGVPSGRYVVRVAAPLPGWTLKSVTAEGRDISETPLDLRTADVNNVVITFTDRPTQLTGVAHGEDGSPDSDALVVVFPADQNAWSDYGPNPRRIRSTHAARNGAYRFMGLPPGDYYVAAIHEDATAWQDPRVLETLARGASQIRLADGETQSQDVKTVKGGSQ